MNDATIGNSYKLPRKDYIMERIKGCNWFSTLDAKSGYWQLRLHENTKPLTTFSCPPQKHYEWNVLPFGLKQAPSIYQKFMDENLEGLNDFCLAYIDDIIIFTKGEKNEHIEKCIKVLERCKTKGLILSKKKSKIVQEEIEYLGIKIRGNGEIDLTSNIQEKINSFPNKLEDRKAIQRFLGVLNYVADQGFIKNLATERKHLQGKISEKVKWNWTDLDSRIVKQMKEKCKILPQLYNPKENNFIIIEADASNDTWAGCMLAIKEGKSKLGLNEFGEIINSNLSEDIPNSQNKLQISNIDIMTDSKLSSQISKYQTILCKYCSGTFKQAELNYPIHEKETLAALRVIEKWPIELLTQRFELRTDSSYVSTFIRNKQIQKSNKGRLIRWYQRFNLFNPIIRLEKSENNPFADTLTREWKELSSN